MNIGPWQLLIVAVVILVLFGRGRISEMMGDFGKGIKSFKQGMNEEERKQERIEQHNAAPTPTPTVTPTAADTTVTPAPAPQATPTPTPTTTGSDSEKAG